MTGTKDAANQTRFWSVRILLTLVGLTVVTGCASRPVTVSKSIYQSGLNQVRLEQDPDSIANTHPTALTATEGPRPRLPFRTRVLSFEPCHRTGRRRNDDGLALGARTASVPLVKRSARSA